MQSSSLHHLRHHHRHTDTLLRFRAIRHSAPPSHLKLPPAPPLHLHEHPSPLLRSNRPMQTSPPRAHSSDLAPIPPSLRTFTALDMASLWVGLVVGVPSYYLAGSLVALGMAWWQGVATVVAANSIVLLLLILTGIPGAKYGIPFPVLARFSFGVRGAHVPTLLRALVGCGWYGIESWIGGQAIFLLLPSSLKSLPAMLAQIPWLGTSALEFSCFLLFWLVQLGIIWRGMEGIRDLEKYSAPVLVLLTCCLLCWAYVEAGGFGPMLSLPSRLPPGQFWPVFLPSLNANISFWATVALNIPDFTRYARSQRDQILGQLGLPVFMGLFTFVGLAVSSSTEVIFGQIISDPIRLLGRIGGGAAALLAIFGVGLATVTTNLAANVVAPANALASLSPSTFGGFRRGALATALLGAALQPWRLLASSESFVYTWLLGCSALVGPAGGIVLADYYLVKGMELDVGALYSEAPRGRYYYRKGFNAAAMAALLVGILPVVPGFLHKLGVLSDVKEVFVVLYNNAWFVSFFVAGTVYWLITTLERIVWKRESS
ncbi:putative purine-uracil permease NCS1 [Iris pallida]|uniref:Purine-uracil permease NCS1 n=1 Tax=Iris pallida TaxID=29817 RepID=A0AAX6GQQ0_IRIPA|nr:putative purine-uracil permease NCS1 [Iris pallida]